MQTLVCLYGVHSAVDKKLTKKKYIIHPAYMPIILEIAGTKTIADCLYTVEELIDVH